MFTLETERLQGKISEAEYVEHRVALEQVLRRVLGRATGVVATESEPMAADLAARSGLKG
jgi:acetylglutamate synthase